MEMINEVQEIWKERKIGVGSIQNTPQTSFLPWTFLLHLMFDFSVYFQTLGSIDQYTPSNNSCGESSCTAFTNFSADSFPSIIVDWKCKKHTKMINWFCILQPVQDIYLL